MDRIWLALLLACALIGAALLDEDAPDPLRGVSRAEVELPSASIERPADLRSTTARRGESATDEMESAVVAQILGRFAIRHTALPERERIALARAIVREAQSHGLAPDLVMAVIEVESAGYHLAQSHVGALGLMQLLPATGKELAGKLGIEWKGPDTLFDPIINVRLGTAYLRQLADRYDGDVNIALAAYNWGPGRIDRRLRRGASVPSRYIEQVRQAADRYAIAAPTRS